MAEDAKPRVKVPKTAAAGEINWDARIGIRVGTEHPWRASLKAHPSVSGKR